MKNVLIAAIIGLVSVPAFADGFTCAATDDTLEVKVYNHRDPAAGTRNSAVMIVSDSALQYGNRTIARFKAPQTLSNEAATYKAKVDLRYNDSNRSGEYIAGTRLGYVDTLVLDVEFSYANPVAAGTELPALLTVTKRNGDEILVDMICERYLVN